MSQLKQDEWPADREPTTKEAQVDLTERDVRGRTNEPGGGAGAVKTDHRSDEDDVIRNVTPDDAVD
jgi:hypothetical protein